MVAIPSGPAAGCKRGTITKEFGIVALRGQRHNQPLWALLLGEQDDGSLKFCLGVASDNGGGLAPAVGLESPQNWHFTHAVLPTTGGHKP
jgi:hypothetical protein